MRYPIAKRSHRTTTILRLNGAPVNGIERIERWIIWLVKDCASHAILCAEPALRPAFTGWIARVRRSRAVEERAMRIARSPSPLLSEALPPIRIEMKIWLCSKLEAPRSVETKELGGFVS